MANDIGVGVIVGLVTSSSIFIYSTNKFNKTQKTILLIFLLFPPAQWLGILVLLAYNDYKKNNSVEKVTQRKIEHKINYLNTQSKEIIDLKEKGLITDEEYIKIINIIDEEKTDEHLKNSQEYKQLNKLFENGILTKEQFQNKVQILKNILLNVALEENYKPKQKIENINIEDIIGKWENEFSRVIFGEDDLFKYYFNKKKTNSSDGLWHFEKKNNNIFVSIGSTEDCIEIIILTKTYIKYRHNKNVFEFDKITKPEIVQK
jgi:uncharacterized protein YqgQ